MWQYKSILQNHMCGTRIINYLGKNFEQHDAIKFLCKAGFMAAKMWEMFVKAFGDSSLSHAMVFRCHRRFVAGEESIEDAEWSGRPGTTKTNENIY